LQPHFGAARFKLDTQYEAFTLKERTMDDRYRALASLAVARQLYDKEKSIYDVLKEYIKAIIIEEKKYVFSSDEITSLLNLRFGFNVKEPVVKTCLRQMNIEHQGSNWNCTLDQLSISEWDKAASNAERKSKMIVQELMNFAGNRNGSDELDYDEDFYAKSFCDFLINDGSVNDEDLRKLYCEFISFKEDDNDFVDVISQLKEGTIFWEGVRYCDNPSEIGARWKGDICLYFDTEILFALSGYNNSLLQDYSNDLLKSIKEINHNCQKAKRIKMKYFAATKQEIDGYFNAAIRIVKRLDALDPTKEAMKQIVNGCSFKSDVEEKRSLMFEKLRSIGIEMDDENYYEDKYRVFNLEDQFLEDKYSLKLQASSNQVHNSLVQLSNINKIRRGENNRGLESCIAIFVTGTRRTLLLSNYEDFIKEHEVPKATTVDFLINYFWLKSNKGFGRGTTPRTLDIIAKSRFILNGMMIDRLSSQFDKAKLMYENNELSKEQFYQVHSDIRDKIYYVENGDTKIVDVLEDVEKWDFKSAEELISYQKRKAKEKDDKINEYSEIIKKQGEENSSIVEDNKRKTSIIQEQTRELTEKDNIILQYQEKENKRKRLKAIAIRIIKGFFMILLIVTLAIFLWGLSSGKTFATVISGIFSIISVCPLFINKKKKKSDRDQLTTNEC
jgi:hypothetical protein